VLRNLVLDGRLFINTLLIFNYSQMKCFCEIKLCHLFCIVGLLCSRTILTTVRWLVELFPTLIQMLLLCYWIFIVIIL